MRLHRLEIEAFGPFAERTAIDFDALSEAGLFLLSGPTGAGKTSVLDAVCFALFGDVPGDRSAAKRLRCDQAPPAVTPRVVLEVTLSQRRFRIERSPMWERPKRRGTGTTVQQSSVTMSEHSNGAWIPLSSRLDETGDLVGRLLGMSLAQFTQVAMLPQGRFQSFLRAKSDERHQLLQQLFRTGRFAEVERWLRDRRLELSRSDLSTHQRMAEVVNRISEANTTPLPIGWDVHDLRPVADRQALLPWAAELLDDARALAGTRRNDVSRTIDLEAAAREDLDVARQDAARQHRYVAARTEQGLLAAAAEEHTEAQRRLDSARRAECVLPAHRQALTASAAAEELRQQRDESLIEVAAQLGKTEPPPPSLLAAFAHSAATDAAEVRAALPQLVRRAHLRVELDKAVARLRELADELTSCRSDQARLPGRLLDLREAGTEARSARERLPALAQAEATLLDRLAAHAEVAALDRDLLVARAEWLHARELTLSLREDLMVLQQARIEGMAAELAGALASGCGCPVCGSPVHPAKAAAAPDAPDAAAEKSARARADDASLIEHAFDAKVRELDMTRAAAAARVGDATAADVRADLSVTKEQRRSIAAQSEALESLLEQLSETERDQERLQASVAELIASQARTQAEHDALLAEVSAIQDQVDQLLTGTQHPDLAALLTHHEHTEAVCRRAHTRYEQAESADAWRRKALAAAQEAAREAGFEDAASAALAALPTAAMQELSRQVDDYRRRRAAVLEILSEPGADELAAAPAPAVGQRELDHTVALTRRDEAAAALHVATARHDRLVGLVCDLEQLAVEWGPLRDDLDLTTRLAGFIEGKSADNRLRMRLSAYVLAYRLSQVVAAANERLARMSDQRYSLEHTGDRGAGETRGGLSLLVRDDWSGESRDPATLSGGETFVVSLALALGLADVVTRESGGAGLDTLFVDEGFGSLDADTLDDVMDTLDSLRDGGRVVGLVSHVAELRDRIPTQLVLSKARGGSTARLRSC
ncbi:MAG: SMC family ATPase [Nocardioides sp.]